VTYGRRQRRPFCITPEHTASFCVDRIPCIGKYCEPCAPVPHARVGL